MADEYTNQLLGQIKGTPLGERVLNYLTQRNAMPNIVIDRIAGGAAGMFTNPPTSKTNAGTLTFDPTKDRNYDFNTLLHELTHAADYQITRDALQYMSSDPQLWDAYQKLHSSSRPGFSFNQAAAPVRPPREEMAYRMSPAWYEKNQEYRASNTELPAWGVADFHTPSSKTTSPSHLNATLAQEFDILLDLASRAKKKK